MKRDVLHNGTEGIFIRKNDKEQVIDYESSIKKSNEFSMAKLNHGLTLNQMQLLAFAIYSTQRGGEKNKFIKADFEKKFGLKEYRTDHAHEDVRRLYELGFATVNLEEDEFDYLRVFQRITYKRGTFSFKWTDDMLPHILELKTYSLIDLTITSKFRSSFSWTLYEYLKAHYGYWQKEISKESLMRLFGVEDVKSYQNNTALLKARVLDLAIEEINKHTEFEVWYTEKKKGRAIVGFVVHWSTGKTPAVATDKQLTLLREIHSEVDKNMFDYLSLKDVASLDQARKYIISIKNIHDELSKGLSRERASEYIQESLMNYKQLETLLENEGRKRDTSFYYNWLDDEGNE